MLNVLKITVHTDIDASIAKKLAAASTKAEHTVAVQAAKDTSPYVPMLTGSLNARTQVDGGNIIYPGPYARYLYYGKVMVDSVTGKGPMHFIDKMGNEQIKFRKGATLKPTDRDLKYTKSAHPQAQDHWFEASKAENLDKWLRVAEKAVKNDL